MGMVTRVRIKVDCENILAEFVEGVCEVDR